MDLQTLIADIEGRMRRTFTAIEGWVRKDETFRSVSMRIENGNWVVEFVDLHGSKEWRRPDVLDALGHAATWCTEQGK